jgi:hypothetical protein
MGGRHNVCSLPFFELKVIKVFSGTEGCDCVLL